MAYLKIAEASAVGQRVSFQAQRSATQILSENWSRFTATSRYDVFLSHSSQDAEVILGVKTIIESLGLSVYVDWLDDNLPDRSRVTVETAEILRMRMRVSASLVYAHSPNASDSVWMPWELGYFDGFKPMYVWILPLVVNYDSEFKGQEYLGLYPTVDKLENIPGKLNLGFPNVGAQRSTIALAEAARGRGVFLKAN